MILASNRLHAFLDSDLGSNGLTVVKLQGELVYFLGVQDSRLVGSTEGATAFNFF